MHVGIVGGAVELLLQAKADGAVPPALDAADGPGVRVIAQVSVGDEHDACAAIGHLAAVEPSQPALDDGVLHVVVGERRRAPSSRGSARSGWRARWRSSARDGAQVASSMP